MKQSQGRTKTEDNTWKEQMEGAWEAMSQIIIRQENERQLDTIRARVIEQRNWRQGQRIACGTWTKGSKECRNHQKHMEVHEDVRRVGNRVAEVGLEYFCLDYVSKNGVSVTEHNTADLSFFATAAKNLFQYSTTSSHSCPSTYIPFLTSSSS